MDFLGGLLSAGSSLIGGLFGSKAANQQFREQDELAHHGLAIKAHDARDAEAKYGINPLVSMGASPASASPVAVGQLGDGIAGMGQGLSTAASALSADNVRAAKLNNDLLEAKIANVKSDTVRNAAAASTMAVHSPKTPGIPALYQQFSDGRGGVVTLPSAGASQAMQNWASIPAQLGVAAGEVGHSIEDAYHSVVSPVTGWISKHGSVPIRGDAWRGASRYFQYPDMPY